MLHAGDVRLDPDSHEVTLRSARVHLPLREFELLRLLMENAGIVLPRATLMNRLWGPSAALGQHEPGSARAAPALEARRRPGRPQAHRHRSRDRVPLPGRTLRPPESSPRNRPCCHCPFIFRSIAPSKVAAL